MVRIDGLLDAEGGATVRTALQAFMKPVKGDERSHGQRQHDALIELCWQRAGGKRDGTGPRPQLIIRASLDTLAEKAGAPAGELEGGGTVPVATVQRYACDTALVRIIGRGELEHELGNATLDNPAQPGAALPPTSPPRPRGRGGRSSAKMDGSARDRRATSGPGTIR